MRRPEILLVFWILLLLELAEHSWSKNVLCYSCRSRTPLGDCRDPFNWNSSSVSNLKSIETTVCPSGWCSKIIEGLPDDPIQATARRCLSRPPQDNIERCSDTFLERRKEAAFICVCKGNLCNTSDQLASMPLLLSGILLLLTRQLFV